MLNGDDGGGHVRRGGDDVAATDQYQQNEEGAGTITTTTRWVGRSSEFGCCSTSGLSFRANASFRKRRKSTNSTNILLSCLRQSPAMVLHTAILALLLFGCSLFGCNSAARAASSPTSTAASQPLLASTAATTAAATAKQQPIIQKKKQQQPNAVVQLAIYVKKSVTQTIDNCGQMWTNHGKCNAIRKKINLHRDDVKREWEELSNDGSTLSSEQRRMLKTKIGGISFEEYVFLQKGKKDRGKVLNLAFLMSVAPRYLPYALLFNPEMLPSPFLDSNTDDGDAASESIWAKQSRERSTAVIEALIRIEKESKSVPALSKINIFGKAKQEARKKQLSSLVQVARTWMTDRDLMSNATTMFSRLCDSSGDLVYRIGEDFDRKEKRLRGVPKPIVRELGKVFGGGGGLLSGLQPHFMTRGSVVGHINQVSESDDFLVSNRINVTTISKRLLQEACSERMILVPPSADTSAVEEMRKNLNEWLDVTVHQPAIRIQQLQQVNRASCYYNANFARMAMMAYHGCLAARDEQSTLQLPRLLYTGSDLMSSSSNRDSRQKIHEGEENGAKSSSGSFWGRLSSRNHRD